MSLLSQAEIAGYLSVVDRVPEKERVKVRRLLEMDRVERCRESYLKEAYQMACDGDWDGAEYTLAELVDYAVQARLSIKEKI